MERKTTHRKHASHATFPAIKKIYLTTSVVWLWLVQVIAVCRCVSAELVHWYKQRSVKNTFRLPVYIGRTLCAPTELTEIQSFQLTRSQDLVKIAAYLQQNCPISLNAMCRKKIFICWQPGAGPANYTWPQVLLILSCFSLSDNTLLEESWFSGLSQIVL